MDAIMKGQSCVDGFPSSETTAASGETTKVITDNGVHKTANGTKDHVTPAGSQETPYTAPSDIHSRPLTQAGSRNLLDSTFSISSENPEDIARRTSIRVQNPPGGKSSGGFW
ncbi:uncharacterized protein LOC124166531 [Ischnura elegans]|uniref:uncharacterized protein LOC124166531 n=1 Tax=Ischnura elegans TaxID=197161 RepID=UPI001ED8B8BD|nr:uncharacterized protein LOC124166531 [Ischnura elegans]